MSCRLYISNFKYMRLFFKILLLGIALVTGQVLIYIYTQQEIPEIKTLDSILQEPQAVIEFSDSVASRTSRTDRDKRSISEMINAIRPNAHVRLLWHSSYTLKVFDSYITYIARSKTKPRAIIVPVNLDGVSPLNEKYPGQLFERLNFILTTRIPLADYIVHPLAVFNVINLNTISVQTWLSQPVVNWDIPAGTVSDCYTLSLVRKPTPAQISAIYTCEYLTPASLQNTNIQALMHLMTTAQDSHIPLLVVVFPVDVEEGSRLLGSSFADHIAHNSTFVCDLATKQNIPCLDLSNTVPNAHFDIHRYPTPHLDQQGRLQTATAISAALQNILAQSKR